MEEADTVINDIVKYRPGPIAFKDYVSKITELILPDSLTSLGTHGLRDFFFLRTFKVPAAIKCLQQDVLPVGRFKDGSGYKSLIVDLNMCSLVKLVKHVYGYSNQTTFKCPNLEVIALDLCGATGDEFVVNLTQLNA